MPNGLDESLLPEQFKTSTKLKGMLEAFLSPSVDLEAQINDLPANTALKNAFGKTLDFWGEIAGEKRLGRSDDVYRTAIRIRLQVNIASGVSSSIIEIVRDSTEATTIIYQDFYPGSYAIFSNGLGAPNLALLDGTFSFLVVDTDDPLLLNGEQLEVVGADFLRIDDLLISSKPAGIGDIEFSFHTNQPTSNTFGFNDGTQQVQQLTVNSTDVIELSSGNILSVNTDLGAVVPPYNFAGFGSLVAADLIINGSDRLQLDFTTGTDLLGVSNPLLTLEQGRFASAFVL